MRNRDVRKKIKEEEFIIYSVQGKEIEQKVKEDIYSRVDKRQKIVAIISSLAIFVYHLAVAWLFATLEYFNKIENNNLWFIIALLIIGLGVILNVVAALIKSKEGKIKYKYKNIKFFYISCLFFALGFFSFFGGLYFIGEMNSSAIGILLFGSAFSCIHYCSKTKGDKYAQLKPLFKVLTIILLCIIYGGAGIAMNYEFAEDDYFLEEYTKSALLIYDKNEIPTNIVKSKNIWYMFFNYNNKKTSELSISDKYRNIEVLYESNEAEINSLSGNDNYAVWSETYDDKIDYNMYDSSENALYLLYTLESTEEYPQSTDIKIYKNCIYYLAIDYNSKIVLLNQYNITTNQYKTIFYVKGFDKSVNYETIYKNISIDDDNIIYVAYSTVPIVFHIDLNRVDEEGYQPKQIELTNRIEEIMDVSYKNGNYVIYYKDYECKKISIYNEKGKKVTNVVKFDKNTEIPNNLLKVTKKNIYWISKYNDENKEKYKLNIYNIKNKNTQEVEDIYNFYISNKNIYGLGYYKGNKKRARLYELYK